MNRSSASKRSGETKTPKPKSTLATAKPTYGTIPRRKAHSRPDRANSSTNGLLRDHNCGSEADLAQNSLSHQTPLSVQLSFSSSPIPQFHTGFNSTIEDASRSVDRIGQLNVSKTSSETPAFTPSSQRLTKPVSTSPSDVSSSRDMYNPTDRVITAKKLGKSSSFRATCLTFALSSTLNHFTLRSLDDMSVQQSYIGSGSHSGGDLDHQHMGSSLDRVKGLRRNRQKQVHHTILDQIESPFAITHTATSKRGQFDQSLVNTGLVLDLEPLHLETLSPLPTLAASLSQIDQNDQDRDSDISGVRVAGKRKSMNKRLKPRTATTTSESLPALLSHSLFKSTTTLRAIDRSAVSKTGPSLKPTLKSSLNSDGISLDPVLLHNLGSPEENPNFSNELVRMFTGRESPQESLEKMAAIFKQIPKAVPRAGPQIAVKKKSENEVLFEQWTSPGGRAKVAQIEHAFINSLSLSDKEKIALLHLSYNGINLNPHMVTDHFNLQIDALTIASRDLLHDQLLSIFFKTPGSPHPTPHGPSFLRRLNHLDPLEALPIQSEGTVQLSTKSNFTSLFPLEHIDKLSERFTVDIAHDPGYSILNTHLHSEHEIQMGKIHVSDPLVTKSISDFSQTQHTTHFDHATGHFFKGTLDEHRLEREVVDDVFELLKESATQLNSGDNTTTHSGYDQFTGPVPQSQQEFQISIMSTVTLARTQATIHYQLLKHLSTTLKDYVVYDTLPRHSEFFVPEYDPSTNAFNPTPSKRNRQHIVDTNTESTISKFSETKRKRILQLLEMLANHSSPQTTRILFQNQFLLKKIDQFTEFVLKHPTFSNFSRFRRATNLLTRSYDMVLPPRAHSAALLANYLSRDDETANTSLKKLTHLTSLRAQNYLTGSKLSEETLLGLAEAKVKEDLEVLEDNTAHRSIATSISPLISPPNFLKHHPNYPIQYGNGSWEPGAEKGRYGSGDMVVKMPGTVDLSTIPHLGQDYALPTHLPSLESLCFDCIGNDALTGFYKDFNEKRLPHLRDREVEVEVVKEDQEGNLFTKTVKKIQKGKKRQKLTKATLCLLPPSLGHFVHLLTSPMHFGNFSTKVYRYSRYGQGKNGQNGQNGQNNGQNGQNDQNQDFDPSASAFDYENTIHYVNAETERDGITPGLFLGVYLNVPEETAENDQNSFFSSMSHQSASSESASANFFNYNGQSNFRSQAPRAAQSAQRHTPLDAQYLRTPVQQQHVLSIDLYRCLHDPEYFLMSFAHIFTDIFDLSTLPSISKKLTSLSQSNSSTGTAHKRALHKSHSNSSPNPHTENPFLPPVFPTDIDFHPNDWAPPGTSALTDPNSDPQTDPNAQNSQNSQNSQNPFKTDLFALSSSPTPSPSQARSKLRLETPLQRKYTIVGIDDIAILPLFNASSVAQQTNLKKHLHSLASQSSALYDAQLVAQKQYHAEMDVYYAQLAEIEAKNSEIHTEIVATKRKNKEIHRANLAAYDAWKSRGPEDEALEAPDLTPFHPLPSLLPLPRAPEVPKPLPTDPVAHVTSMTRAMGQFGVPIGATVEKVVDFGVLQSGLKYRWLQSVWESVRYEYIKERYRNAEELVVDGQGEVAGNNRVKKIVELQQAPTEFKKLRLLRGDDNTMTRLKNPKLYGKDLSDDEWQALRKEDDEGEKWANFKEVKLKFDREGKQLDQLNSEDVGSDFDSLDVDDIDDNTLAKAEKVIGQRRSKSRTARAHIIGEMEAVGQDAEHLYGNSAERKLHEKGLVQEKIGWDYDPKKAKDRQNTQKTANPQDDYDDDGNYIGDKKDHYTAEEQRAVVKRKRKEKKLSLSDLSENEYVPGEGSEGSDDDDVIRAGNKVRPDLVKKTKEERELESQKGENGDKNDPNSQSERKRRKMTVDEVASLLDRGNVREMELDDLIDVINEYKGIKTMEIKEDPLLQKYKKSLYDPLSLLPTPIIYTVDFVRALADVGIFEDMWIMGNDVALESTEVISNSFSRLGFPELALSLLPITNHNTYSIYSANVGSFVDEHEIKPHFKVKLQPTISMLEHVISQQPSPDLDAAARTRYKIVDPFLSDFKGRIDQMGELGLDSKSIQTKKLTEDGKVISSVSPDEILMTGVAQNDEEYRQLMVALVSQQFILNVRNFVDLVGSVPDEVLDERLLALMSPQLHQRREKFREAGGGEVQFKIPGLEGDENEQNGHQNGENDENNDQNGQNDQNVDPLSSPTTALLNNIYDHVPLSSPTPTQLSQVLTDVLQQPEALTKLNLFVKPSVKFVTQYQSESVLAALNASQDRYSVRIPTLSKFDSNILEHVQDAIIKTIHGGGSMATVQVVSKLRTSLREVMMKRLKQKIDIFSEAVQFHSGRLNATGMVSSQLLDAMDSGMGMGAGSGGRGGKGRGRGGAGGSGDSGHLLKIFQQGGRGNNLGQNGQSGPDGAPNGIRIEPSMKNGSCLEAGAVLSANDDGMVLLDFLFRHSNHGVTMINDARKKQPAFDAILEQTQLQKQMALNNSIQQKQTALKSLQIDPSQDPTGTHSVPKGRLYELDPNDSGTEFTSDDEDVRSFNKNASKNAQNASKNAQNAQSRPKKPSFSIASKVNSLQTAAETSFLDPKLMEQSLEQDQALYRRLQPGFSAPPLPILKDIDSILPIFTQTTPFLQLGVSDHTSDAAKARLEKVYYKEGEFPSVAASVLTIESHINSRNYSTALDLIVQTLQRFTTHKDLKAKFVAKHGNHTKSDSRRYQIGEVDPTLMPSRTHFPYPELFSHGFMLCQAMGDWSTGIWLLTYAKQYRFSPSLSQLSQLAQSGSNAMVLPNMGRILQARLKKDRNEENLKNNTSTPGSPSSSELLASDNSDALIVRTKTLQHLRQQVGRKLWLTTKANVVRSKVMTIDVPFVLSILQLFHSLDDAMQLFYEAVAWPVHLNTKFFLKFQQNLERIQIEEKTINFPISTLKIAGTSLKPSPSALSRLDASEAKRLTDFNQKFVKMDEYLQFLMSKFFAKQFQLFQKMSLDNVNLLQKLNQIQLDHRLSHAQALGDVDGALKIIEDLYVQQRGAVGAQNGQNGQNLGSFDRSSNFSPHSPNSTPRVAISRDGRNLSQFSGLTATHWGYLIGAIVNKWKLVNISQDNATLAQALTDPMMQRANLEHLTENDKNSQNLTKSSLEPTLHFSQNGSNLQSLPPSSSSSSSHPSPHPSGSVSASNWSKAPRFVLTSEQQQDLLLAQRVFLHCVLDNKLEDHHLWINLLKTFNIFFDSASILGLTQFMLLLNGQANSVSFLPFNLNSSYNATHWNENSFTHYPVTWSSVDEARDRISYRQRAILEKQQKQQLQEQEDLEENAKLKKISKAYGLDDSDLESSEDSDDLETNLDGSPKEKSKIKSKSSPKSHPESDLDSSRFYAPDLEAIDEQFSQVDAVNFNSMLLGSYSFRVKSINQKNVWNALDLNWTMQDLVGNYQIKGAGEGEEDGEEAEMEEVEGGDTNGENAGQNSASGQNSAKMIKMTKLSPLELNICSLLGTPVTEDGPASEFTQQLIAAVRRAKDQKLKEQKKRKSNLEMVLESAQNRENSNENSQNSNQNSNSNSSPSPSLLSSRRILSNSAHTNRLFGYVLPWTLNDRLRLQSSLDSLQTYMTFYYSRLREQNITIPGSPAPYSRPLKHGSHTLMLTDYEKLVVGEEGAETTDMTETAMTTTTSTTSTTSSTKTPKTTTLPPISSPFTPSEVSVIGPVINPKVHNSLDLSEFPTATTDSYSLSDLQNSFPTLHALNPATYTTPDQVIDSTHIDKVAKMVQESELFKPLHIAQGAKLPDTISTQDLPHGLLNQHPVLSLFSPLHSRVIGNSAAALSADVLNIALPHLAKVSPTHALSALLWMINASHPALNQSTRRFKMDYVDKYANSNDLEATLNKIGDKSTFFGQMPKNVQKMLDFEQFDAKNPIETTATPSPLDIIESLQRPFIAKRNTEVVKAKKSVRKGQQGQNDQIDQNNDNNDQHNHAGDYGDFDIWAQNDDQKDGQDGRDGQDDQNGENYDNFGQNGEFSEQEERRSIFSLEDSDLDFGSEDFGTLGSRMSGKHKQQGRRDGDEKKGDEKGQNDQLAPKKAQKPSLFGSSDPNSHSPSDLYSQVGSDLTEKDIFGDTLGEKVISTQHTVALTTTNDSLASSPETQYILNNLPETITAHMSQQEQLRHVQLAKINNELVVNGYHQIDIAGVILSTSRALFSSGYYGMAIKAYDLAPNVVVDDVEQNGASLGQGGANQQKQQSSQNSQNSENSQHLQNSQNQSTSDESAPLPTSLLTSTTSPQVTDSYTSIYLNKNPPIYTQLALNAQSEGTKVVALNVANFDPVHAALVVRSQLQKLITGVLDKMMLHQKTYHVTKAQYLAQEFRKILKRDQIGGQNAQNTQNSVPNDQNDQNDPNAESDFDFNFDQSHVPDDVSFILKAVQEQTAASSYNPYETPGLVVTTGDFLHPDRTLQESLIFHFNKEFNPTLRKRSLKREEGEEVGLEGQGEEFFGKHGQKGPNKASHGIISTVPVVIDMLYQDNTTSTIYNQYLMYGDRFGGAVEGEKNKDANFEDLYRYLFDTNNTGKLIITPYTITNIAYNIFRQMTKTTNALANYAKMESSIENAIALIATHNDLERLGLQKKFGNRGHRDREEGESGEVLPTALSSVSKTGDVIYHADGLEFDPDDISNGQEYLRRMGELDIATVIMEQFYQNLEQDQIQNQESSQNTQNTQNSQQNSHPSTPKPILQPTLYSWWQPSGESPLPPSLTASSSSSSSLANNGLLGSGGKARNGARLYLFEPTQNKVPKEHYNGTLPEPNSLQVVDYLWKPPNVTEWMLNSYRFEEQLERNRKQHEEAKRMKKQNAQNAQNAHQNSASIDLAQEALQMHQKKRQPAGVFTRESVQKAIDQYHGNEIEKIASAILNQSSENSISSKNIENHQNSNKTGKQAENQTSGKSVENYAPAEPTPAFLKVKTAGMLGTTIGAAPVVPGGKADGQNDKNGKNGQNGKKKQTYKDLTAATVAAADAAPAPPPRAGTIGIGQFSNYYKTKSAFYQAPPEKTPKGQQNGKM